MKSLITRRWKKLGRWGGSAESERKPFCRFERTAISHRGLAYDYILALELCKNGQKVLDIGTGTGVLPRNMYKYGAEWVGTDIADNQIEQAKRIADDAGMNIDFFASEAGQTTPEVVFQQMGTNYPRGLMIPDGNTRHNHV